MEQIIEDLSLIRDVRGVILVSTDGLVIASSGKFVNDVEFIGASVYEAFSAANLMTSERMDSGKTLKLFIESEQLMYAIYCATEDTFLIIVIEHGGNLGIINIEAAAAIAKLKEML